MPPNHTYQTSGVQTSKKLNIISWTLGLLFILKSLDFFFSISLVAESEFYLTILEAILFIVSGIAMLLLAWGVIKKLSWVRTPLYVVFVANAVFLVYRVFVVPNWPDAVLSLVGVVLLWHYLSQTKNLYLGRRLVTLQILTILTLLPATIFISLSVLFQDEALQDDTTMHLEEVSPLAESENLYIALTTLGTELPESAEQARRLITDYPSQWNQVRANALLQVLQPHVDAYLIAANKSGYQCPTSVNNFSMQTEFCELNLLRDYAQLIQFAAITEAERGNVTLAQEYALATIKVGRTMVQADNVTLFEYLVGLVSVNIGLDTIDNLIQQDIFTSVKVSQLLQNTTISTESLSTPVQREYLGLKLALDESLNIQQSYLYHPNRTRNELFTFMSQVVENSTTGCVADEINSPSEANTELLSYIEDIKTNAINPTQPNMIGRIYLSAVFASLSNVKDNVCKVNARIAGYKN